MYRVWCGPEILKKRYWKKASSATCRFTDWNTNNRKLLSDDYTHQNEHYCRKTSLDVLSRIATLPYKLRNFVRTRFLIRLVSDRKVIVKAREKRYALQGNQWNLAHSVRFHQLHSTSHVSNKENWISGTDWLFVSITNGDLSAAWCTFANLSYRSSR